MISIIIPIKDESPEIAERFRPFSIAGETEILLADRGDCLETTRAFELLRRDTGEVAGEDAPVS